MKKLASLLGGGVFGGTSNQTAPSSATTGQSPQKQERNSTVSQSPTTPRSKNASLPVMQSTQASTNVSSTLFRQPSSSSIKKNSSSGTLNAPSSLIDINSILFNTTPITTQSTIPNVQPEYYLKFLVLGGPGVGKSGLINRYLKNKDHPSLVLSNNSQSIPTGTYIPTVGVDLYSKSVKKFRNQQIGKQKMLQYPIRLSILDVPHSEQAKNTSLRYFDGCHAILLVFDITNVKSVSAIDQWRSVIPSHLISNTILLAHKADLKPHVITSQSLDNYIRDSGLLAWFSTSIRNLESISDVFNCLIDRTLTKMLKKHGGLPTLNHQMNMTAANRKIQSNSVTAGGSENRNESSIGDASPFSTSVGSNSDAGSMKDEKTNQIFDAFNLCDLLEEKNPIVTSESVEKLRIEITSFYAQLSNRFKEFKTVCENKQNVSDSELMDMLVNECGGEKILFLNKLSLAEKEINKTTTNSENLATVTKLYIEIKREFYLRRIEKWVSFWHSLKTRFYLNEIFFNSAEYNDVKPELSMPVSAQNATHSIVERLYERRQKIAALLQTMKQDKSNVSDNQLLVENENTFAIINEAFQPEVVGDLYPTMVTIHSR